MSFKGSLARLKYNTKEAAPALYLAAGIVGFVGTVVLACHATTKVSAIIDEHTKDMDDIRVTRAKVETADPEYSDTEYTDKDAKKDKLIVTTHTAVRLVKVYSPAIIVGGLSVASFLASYHILHKRYVAAATLAVTLSEAFSKYRKRVVDEFGEEVDQRLYYDAHLESVTQMDGKKVKTTEYEVVDEASDIPPYAKFFDEASRNWSKNPQVNLMFLKGLESRFQDQFEENGFLFLNEVYRAIDIPETDLGNEVGWFKSHGDQFVSFGIFNGNDERKRAFVNGFEPSILLAFNCVPKRPGDLPKF